MITELYGADAKNFVANYFSARALGEDMTKALPKWIDVNGDACKCFIYLTDDMEISAFAIVTVCPYYIHNARHTVHFVRHIYVAPEYERDNRAYDILLYLREDRKVLVSCRNRELMQICKELEFVKYMHAETLVDEFALFRYPG